MNLNSNFYCKICSHLKLDTISSKVTFNWRYLWEKNIYYICLSWFYRFNNNCALLHPLIILSIICLTKVNHFISPTLTSIFFLTIIYSQNGKIWVTKIGNASTRLLSDIIEDIWRIFRDYSNILQGFAYL